MGGVGGIGDPGTGGVGDPSSDEPQGDDAFARDLPNAPASKRHIDISGRKQGESDDLNPSQSPTEVSEMSRDKAHSSGGRDGLTVQNLGSRHAHRDGTPSLPENLQKSGRPIASQVGDGGPKRTIL
jgi:hypothetical protein